MRMTRHATHRRKDSSPSGCAALAEVTLASPGLGTIWHWGDEAEGTAESRILVDQRIPYHDLEVLLELLSIATTGQARATSPPPIPRP